MAANNQSNHDAMAEQYEEARINALPQDLQSLVLLHHTDQLEAVPSYVEGQANDFVGFCDALGIGAEKE